MTSNACVRQPRRATDLHGGDHGNMIGDIVVVECDALSPTARARGGRSILTMRQRIERMTRSVSCSYTGGGATRDNSSEVVFDPRVTPDRLAG